MPRDELAAWLRLLLTPGLGRSTARQLLAAFGLPEAIWARAPDSWDGVVEPSLAKAMAQPPEGFDAALNAHERWLAQDNARHVLTLADPRYPASLLDTADPPLMLFVHGRLEALSQPQRLAVVGSRNPTPQGAQNAEAFAHSLAASGLCIVSGLALGVDGAAHEGALRAGGFTLAVVGTGLDRVYPSRHRDLAHRIVAHGAMISEYPLGTPPLAQNFPQRNRVIAGLSMGTLVVEAALQSGSLITARLASEQGREVFAIPGSIHSPQSRGCHALIRQGAKLVESAQDVLEELRLADTAPSSTDGGPAAQPLGPEGELLEAMGHDPVNLDALQARTGLPTSALQAQLLELELQGLVARLPGGLLQRVGQG
ncbi:MAG: DNA-protecting protein DprA [Hydrogenophaga sp.]|uniref:DNA-processing protein DprA n=1 Tax=Hydrogenophaga sp. TaxID=1904254 RepID=UPI0016A55494|nr:DNA-processing protein DprA [Hydrogenophaga sp.]NIM39739.1 DNA-protecting protein DprA [Hydrogenophaga sp.]NIN24943.1 DNA-protecting protein DprA [Hydrogenophaga sp.]NIN29455.1 DNA-protecting protein DprA [Hydrogenophaga sp.]NIN53978.1 DNA-protecting protein DprA [Hydrogenophaga sp.]NIO50182.1 DNA-protecting protein DprA [Hydrogenophaga sp.]